MLDSTVLELYNEFNGLDTFKDVSTAVSFLNHLEDAGMIEKLGEEIVSELTYILNAKQTASYLEGGVNNRITMSIRSAIASEIDWALDRLIVVSYTEPDILRLTDFPGLLNGLLDLVRDFVDAVNGLPSHEHGALIKGMEGNQRTSILRRRATEASMVLRNLSGEKLNLKSFSESKRLIAVIVSALEVGNHEDEEKEGSAELRVYLLEVLEFVGEFVSLALPGRSLSNGRSSQPEDASSPSVRLFPLLVALTTSTDRALVLLAYRCLAALSLNEVSDPVLSLSTYNLPQLAVYHLFPHPIHTAIDLLPLADADISMAALNFIYRHTLLPSNAALFCSRPELIHILRLVCTKLHIGETKEVLEVVIPMKGAESDHWHSRLPRLHNTAGVPAARELSLKLLPADPLHTVAEPLRTLTW